MASGLKDRLVRQASGDTGLDFDPTGADEPRLVSILVSLIDPDTNQPRKNAGDLTELASSIRDYGLINPVIVELAGNGRFRLIAGERRYAACRLVGFSTVPCIVRTVAEQSRLTLQLIENLQRKDLHPLEEARAFKRLMDEFNLTQRDLATRLGKSPASINQTLRILNLNASLLADVQTSEYATKSVLLEIAKEPDPKRQLQLWQQTNAGQLSVREARKQKTENSFTKSRKAACTIELPDAKLIIRFFSGEPSSDRVQAVLNAALILGREKT
ncbi:MAG: ParB/RepB/Spo0J family partition protein [Verrucomicrobiales bacterium]|nr:ParB/RepB/Spo0J family partition protein [Verrucomicrobiales bacterium]